MNFKKQAGISLFIVMIIVLLTAILVAMGFRSSQFNETVTGNTAEYQRTYEAAQSLMHDAELDIMRATAHAANCTGTNCRTYLGPISDLATPNGTIYFPMADQLSEVFAALTSSSTGCIAGVCRPLQDTADPQKPEIFWTNDARLTALKTRAAHYGQYTGGPFNSASKKFNQRLNNTNSWYWVEILPYATNTGVFGGTTLAPTDMDAIYRITVLVEGERNTKSIIQKIVVGKSTAI